MGGLRRVLTVHRDYRLLLGAGLVSLTGDWILAIGLTYQVYALTGSTLASATALLAQLLPQIGLGTLAGACVDRWDRRRTMVAANVLLALALLPLLAVDGTHRIWVIYLVLAVESGLSQLVVAAEPALVPHLVPPADLVTANALNGQNRDIARLTGAALGGLTAAFGGIALLALVDAASFALAAVLLALIRRPPAPNQTLAPNRPPAPNQPPHRERRPEHARRPRPVRERFRAAAGLRSAARSLAGTAWRGPLRAVLLFVALTGLGEGIMDTLMAPFVRDVLHAGADAYGLILSAQAAGGIAGGLVAATFGPRLAPRVLLGYGSLCFGALDLLLFCYPVLIRAGGTGAAAPPLWPAFAIMITVGLPGALTVAGLTTTTQISTGDGSRGRLLGTASALRGATMLAGAGLAGALGSGIGIVPVIAIQGAGYCVAGLLVLPLLRGTPAAQPLAGAFAGTARGTPPAPAVGSAAQASVLTETPVGRR